MLQSVTLQCLFDPFIFQLVQPQISVTSSPQLEIVFCMEQWVKTEKIDDKNISFRGIYSVTVVVLQYLLPLLIVLLIYGMIYKFVREQRYPRHLRQNKTNFLLMIISLTHCIIWLPFSVFNILADLWPDEVNIITQGFFLTLFGHKFHE